MNAGAVNNTKQLYNGTIGAMIKDPKTVMAVGGLLSPANDVAGLFDGQTKANVARAKAHPETVAAVAQTGLLVLPVGGELDAAALGGLKSGVQSGVTAGKAVAGRASAAAGRVADRLARPGKLGETSASDVPNALSSSMHPSPVGGLRMQASSDPLGALRGEVTHDPVGALRMQTTHDPQGASGVQVPNPQRLVRRGDPAPVDPVQRLVRVGDSSKAQPGQALARVGEPLRSPTPSPPRIGALGGSSADPDFLQQVIDVSPEVKGGPVNDQQNVPLLYHRTGTPDPTAALRGGAWPATHLIEGARTLKEGGAGALVFTDPAAYAWADAVSKSAGLPVLPLRDALANEVQ
ncbi:MAG: hypothetical protein ACREQ5_12480, partial [Candidatus Dormibacteria bacterium]